MTMQHIREVFERCPDIRGKERLVLIALAFHADSQGCAWPTQATLATEAGINERNARKALSWLLAEGVIVADGYRNRRRVWRMNLPAYPVTRDLSQEPRTRSRVTYVDPDEPGHTGPMSPDRSRKVSQNDHIGHTGPPYPVTRDPHNHHEPVVRSMKADSEVKPTSPCPETHSGIRLNLESGFTPEEAKAHAAWVDEMRKAVGDPVRPPPNVKPIEDVSALRAALAVPVKTEVELLREALARQPVRNSGRVVQVDFHSRTLGQVIDEARRK